MQTILIYNNTSVTSPINIPKEAPLMVVTFTVRHCDEKCVVVLVWWFGPKECNINILTPLMAILLYVAIWPK